MLRTFAIIAAMFTPWSAYAADLMLDAASGHTIPVEINGRKLMLRVDPGISSRIILNPAAAEAAGLKGSLIGAKAPVGPVVLKGKSNRPKVKIGGVEMRKTVVWMDRNAFEGADGLISPMSLPYDNVTLQLGSVSPASSRIEIPVSHDAMEGIYLRYGIGSDTIVVRFSTVNPTTQATASAGAHIASHHSGFWQAPVTRQIIRFGVERPVRKMALQRPLNLNGLKIADLFVRTNDNRGGPSLPSDPAADADEIVVTAAVKSNQPRRLLLMVGLDHLSACTSFTYRRASRSIALMC